MCVRERESVCVSERECVCVCVQYRSFAVAETFSLPEWKHSVSLPTIDLQPETVHDQEGRPMSLFVLLPQLISGLSNEEKCDRRGKRVTYCFLSLTPEGKGPIERPSCRCEKKQKWILRTYCDRLWIQHRSQWCAP